VALASKITILGLGLENAGLEPIPASSPVRESTYSLHDGAG